LVENIKDDDKEFAWNVPDDDNNDNDDDGKDKDKDYKKETKKNDNNMLNL